MPTSIGAGRWPWPPRQPSWPGCAPSWPRIDSGVSAPTTSGNWPTGDVTARVRWRMPAGGTFSPHCARIQPAKLVRGLADAVARRGVAIYERTPAVGARARVGSVRLRGDVRAPWVVRATEGSPPALTGLRRRRLLPMNSSMIVTEPLPAETWPRSAGRERDRPRRRPRLRLRPAHRGRPDRHRWPGHSVPVRFSGRPGRADAPPPQPSSSGGPAVRSFPTSGQPASPTRGAARSAWPGTGARASGWPSRRRAVGVGRWLRGRWRHDFPPGRPHPGRSHPGSGHGRTALPWVGHTSRTGNPSRCAGSVCGGCTASTASADRAEQAPRGAQHVSLGDAGGSALGSAGCDRSTPSRRSRPAGADWSPVTPDGYSVATSARRSSKPGWTTSSQSPEIEGTLELLVRRPASMRREILEEGELDLARWSGWRQLATQTEHVNARRVAPPRRANCTLMNATWPRWSPAREPGRRWPATSCIVDLDLSEDSLPTGTWLRASARRYRDHGQASSGLRQVRGPLRGRTPSLCQHGRRPPFSSRGRNARVIVPGTVRRGRWSVWPPERLAVLTGRASGLAARLAMR